MRKQGHETRDAGARGGRCLLLCLFALCLAVAGCTDSHAIAEDSGKTLKILTFNLWHGLSPKGSISMVSLEPPDQREVRMNDFLRRIREEPVDLLFLQEANPAPTVARRLARALEMDEIHQVCNAGVKLLVGVPPGLRTGNVILARRGLGLRPAASIKLPESGPCWCGDTFAFQLKEHRYALVGRIEWNGKPIVVVGTHLHHTRPLDDETRERLAKAARKGEIPGPEHEKIVRAIDDRVTRRCLQARALEELLGREYPDVPVVLAGDFNAEPGSEEIQRFVGSRGLLDTYAEKGAPPGYTWDPSRNPNTLLRPPGWRGATYPNETAARIMKAREMKSRRIDYIFLNRAFTREQVLSSRLFASEPMLGGLYCSDHFGVLTEVRFWE